MPLGFLPLTLGKIVYGGFNPNGTSGDPAIALGRSISHGIRPGTSPNLQPVYGNSPTGYPPIDMGDGSNLPPAAQVDEPVVQTNRDFQFNQPANANSAAAQAYTSIAQQPGIPDNLQPRTPFGGMLPGGMPQSREFGGTGFGNYASAQNSFIPGLIDYNGPGQAQGPGGEQSLASLGGPDTQGARNFLGLARRLGGMGIEGGPTSMAHAIAASLGPTPGYATANGPKIRGRG